MREYTVELTFNRNVIHLVTGGRRRTIKAQNAISAINEFCHQESIHGTDTCGDYTFQAVEVVENEKQRKIRETKQKMEELRTQLTELEQTLGDYPKCR